jgi:hypothetical protein
MPAEWQDRQLALIASAAAPPGKVMSLVGSSTETDFRANVCGALAAGTDVDFGRDDGPVPAHVELVVGGEDAAVEDLERRLEQRRPRALQDHRAFLREGRRQRALPRSTG